MSAALAAALMLAGASPPGDQAVQIAPAFEATQALQGPLDGEWRLDDRAGHTLYVFSLSDPGDGAAALARDPAHPGVEGAWQAPGRLGSAGSGFIETVSNQGGGVRIAFSDGQAETVVLHRAAQGQWVGTLVRAGQRLPVTMTRF